MQRAGGLVVFDDRHAGRGQRILEIGKQLARFLHVGWRDVAPAPGLGGHEHGQGRDGDISEGALVIVHSQKISCIAGSAAAGPSRTIVDLIGQTFDAAAASGLRFRSSGLTRGAATWRPPRARERGG